jgi:hypothetical protein
MRGWRLVGLFLAVLLVPVAGCGSNRAEDETAAHIVEVALGTNGAFDEVQYVAFEKVGMDRLPRARMEEAGEAQIESLARRIPAYRLANSPRAALRYTQDSSDGWLAWQPLAVLYARRELAQRQRQPVAAIQTVDVTHETWTDTCLGAPRDGESCGQASIPGFRVTLRLSGRVFVYHTDLTDRTVIATA